MSVWRRQSVPKARADSGQVGDENIPGRAKADMQGLGGHRQGSDTRVLFFLVVQPCKLLVGLMSILWPAFWIAVRI